METDTLPARARAALRLGPLLHELVVELLDLADVVLNTGAEGGDTEVVGAGLLTEARTSDGADTGGICKLAHEHGVGVTHQGAEAST